MREIGLQSPPRFARGRRPQRSSAISASVFAEVKIFWIHFPRLQPAGVQRRQKHDQQNARSNCCQERLSAYLAESAIGATIQAVGEIAGTEHAEKSRKGHGHRGDRARLDHQEERPAVEKAPKRRVGFAQVNVLAAGLGHHRRELAVGERRADGQKAGDRSRRRAGRPPNPSGARYRRRR